MALHAVLPLAPLVLPSASSSSPEEGKQIGKGRQGLLHQLHSRQKEEAASAATSLASPSEGCIEPRLATVHGGQIDSKRSRVLKSKSCKNSPSVKVIIIDCIYSQFPVDVVLPAVPFDRLESS